MHGKAGWFGKSVRFVKKINGGGGGCGLKFSLIIRQTRQTVPFQVRPVRPLVLVLLEAR